MINFYNFIETFKIFSSIIMPILLYNIPLTLNNYIVPYLPQQLYSDTVYNFLFNFVYRYPINLILFIYTYKKIPHIFHNLGYQYSNLPDHPYIFLLFILTYIVLIVPSIFISNIYILIILNILVYSVYLSQIVYLFLNPNIYSFTNNKDFYNSNMIIFNVCSIIYSIIDIILIERLRLIWLSIYTLIFVPVLLKFSFNIPSELGYINFFYIPERVLTKILMYSNEII